jgi:hypothetical protein
VFGGSSALDGAGATAAWLLEGEAAAGGTGTLHISLELAWHSAVSSSMPSAAVANDTSVIELELRPAAAQQSQRWHRIGRCAASFLPAPAHDAGLARSGVAALKPMLENDEQLTCAAGTRCSSPWRAARCSRAAQRLTYRACSNDRRWDAGARRPLALHPCCFRAAALCCAENRRVPEFPGTFYDVLQVKEDLGQRRSLRSHSKPYFVKYCVRDNAAGCQMPFDCVQIC